MSSQQSNHARFQFLVAEHVAAASAHAAALWAPHREELLVLAKTPVADLSDEVLADVARRFLWGEPSSVHVQINGLISAQSLARFKLVCELSGLGSDTQAALERGDAWEVAAEHGIARADARAATDQIGEATVAGQGIDEFLAQCQKERADRDTRERARWIEVDGQRHAVLATTPVLWSGWECDGAAWVIERDGRRVLVTTNHGGQVLGDEALLRSKLDEYRQAIENTEKLLAVLDGAPAIQP